uniref:Uncharacterized protein n=1 Tax=Anguilla anguilla TaxID=7936 RepID=A0A0E9U970_ANGAN
MLFRAKHSTEVSPNTHIFVFPVAGCQGHPARRCSLFARRVTAMFACCWACSVIRSNVDG